MRKNDTEKKIENRIETLLSRSIDKLSVTGGTGDLQDAPSDVSIDAIDTRPDQPRRRFDQASLDQLAASIRQEGVLQPILVTPRGNGRYLLVCGERRLRAARQAGLRTIPAIVRDMCDEDIRRYALIENLQREDLNPFEETAAVLELLSIWAGLSVEQAATSLNRLDQRVRRRNVDGARFGTRSLAELEDFFNTLGRFSWRSFTKNRLPLLNLPEDLKEALSRGAIPYKIALALRRVTNAEERAALIRQAQAGASSQEIHARIRQLTGRPKSTPPEDVERAIRRLKTWSAQSIPDDRKQKVLALIREINEILDGADTRTQDGRIRG